MLTLLLSWYFYHNVGFYKIALLNLSEVLEYHTTLRTRLNFLDIILEMLKCCDRSFIDLLFISRNSYNRILSHSTFCNDSTCDVTNTRSLEYLSDFSMTDNLFLIYRLKHTLKSCLNILDSIVNNAVKS